MKIENGSRECAISCDLNNTSTKYKYNILIHTRYFVLHMPREPMDDDMIRTLFALLTAVQLAVVQQYDRVLYRYHSLDDDVLICFAPYVPHTAVKQAPYHKKVGYEQTRLSGFLKILKF